MSSLCRQLWLNLKLADESRDLKCPLATSSFLVFFGPFVGLDLQMLSYHPVYRRTELKSGLQSICRCCSFLVGKVEEWKESSIVIVFALYWEYVILGSGRKVWPELGSVQADGRL